MLKAAGEEGNELVRQLAEAVFSSGEIPEEWEESFTLNLYKGKGTALHPVHYHSLKLTDQDMEAAEIGTWLLLLHDGEHWGDTVSLCA